MATGGLLLIFWPEGGFSSHPSELKDGNENKRVLKQLIPTAHIFHPLPERKGQTKSLFLAPFLNSEKNVSGANRHNALDVGITCVTPVGVILMILYFGMIYKVSDLTNQKE